MHYHMYYRGNMIRTVKGCSIYEQPEAVRMGFKIADDYRGDLLMLYKMDLQKLQKSLFVLKLSNKAKLSLIGNTFEDNVGVSGTVINAFIEVNSTEAIPAVTISNNNFTRNYATVSGSSMIIVSQIKGFFARWRCGDLPLSASLTEVGNYLVKKNTWHANAGCTTSTLNNLLACFEPIDVTENQYPQEQAFKKYHEAGLSQNPPEDWERYLELVHLQIC